MDGERRLVSGEERALFPIMLVVTVAIYFLLIISLVGILYIILAFLFMLVVQGLLVGNIKNNAVQVTPRQFPKVHDMARDLAARMGLSELPEIYILQAGGDLNAFATKFFSRDFVVIYSDVLEMAFEQGEQEVAFILAHELAHVKRKHLVHRAWLYPAMLVPFLSQAYSRACEHTCDIYGAHLAPEGAVNGILVLAAGKKLYRDVDVEEFKSQPDRASSVWADIAELMSTHPPLPKRIKAIDNFRRGR